MLDYQIQTILQELLVEPSQNAYQDDQVDALMLEIKNLKNSNDLNAAQLLSNSVLVLLNRLPLHRNAVDDWPNLVSRTFKPFSNLWHYLRCIADDDDKSECIFQVYEYCQNPRRPHLEAGFGIIISSLLAGDIICPVSAVKFIEAMENSDDVNERHAGVQLVPFLSRSCPW